MLTDTLENGAEPRPWLRGLAAGLVLVLLVAVVAVSVHRASDKRHERASFDRLLALAIAGEASVESAVSRVRDVAQYAEPLLNSSLTPAAERQTLYASVSASARQAQIVIDTAVHRLSAASVGQSKRLRSAQAATVAYLSSWASVFASAAGAEDASGSPPIDLATQRADAATALQKAAPDRKRASNAATALGASDS